MMAKTKKRKKRKINKDKVIKTAIFGWNVYKAIKKIK